MSETRGVFKDNSIKSPESLESEDAGNLSSKSLILELVENFLSSIFVLFLLYKFVAMPEVVSGASMQPNFESGERILMERITKHFKPFERGEVVILHPPGNDHKDYIKRIVGLPGDIIKIKDCQVYINRDGERFILEETYLPSDVCTVEGPQLKEGRSLRLKEGEYAVMGDNRADSIDSRVFGVLKEERILGRVVFRFWPLERLGFL
ncbi:signal peptidase I [candidate division WWE3 bacterium]|nr:signal peptidase I [candidate division WWE3 bacterium]